MGEINEASIGASSTSLNNSPPRRTRRTIAFAFSCRTRSKVRKIDIETNREPQREEFFDIHRKYLHLLPVVSVSSRKPHLESLRLSCDIPNKQPNVKE